MPAMGLLASARDRLDRIEEDYSRMLTYMESWHNDPNRSKLYDNLLYRLWQLAADIDMAYKRNNVKSYVNAVNSCRHLNISHDFLRSVLEAYVTDLAMSTLFNENEKSNENELRSRHFNFLCQLFNYIWTSYQWDEGEMEFYAELLSSSSVDTDDAITLVSAILLGACEQFDLNKLRTLTIIYQKAENQQVRQTALTAIMLALPSDMFPFSKIEEILNELSADKQFRDEVAMLQIQVLNCMNTENDRKVIEEDIMPAFIKNQNVAYKNLGLVDDESSVEDIINPEREERLMDELEEKAMKMIDMQKEGADVYFGGFSQAKRSYFFQEMMNWWVPFNANNPRLSEGVRNALKNNKFLRIIVNSGSFCPSDKYSLAVMSEHIVNNLPNEVTELQNEEDFLKAEINQGIDSSNSQSIRRYLLQNIYRFYNLYSDRGDFRNPLNHLFILSPAFNDPQWDKAKIRIGHKLMKYKRWNMLSKLMSTCEERTGETSYMTGCSMLYGSHAYSEARRMFEKALDEMPDNERIMRLKARCEFLDGDYSAAENSYLTLAERQEDKPTYRLNACIAMMQQEKYEEALKMLYRLDFTYEGNEDIKRHIAWALLMSGKIEKARDQFLKITNNGSSTTNSENYIGLGYCHWLLRETNKAVDSFKNYLQNENTSVNTLTGRMRDDIKLLNKHQIDENEIYMMSDVISQYMPMPPTQQ